MKSIIPFLALTGATSESRVPELGRITVANATTNYAASLDEPLTAYLAGQAAPDLEERLELLCPSVEAGRFFQYPVAENAAFLTENDDSDIRATGAAFKRVESRGTKNTDKVSNKGLTIRVDHDDIPRVNGRLASGWEQAKVNMLRKRLIRAEMVRFLALLEANDSNSGKTWNSSSNPDGDLRALVLASRAASGLTPTHVVLGTTAQSKRQDVYEAVATANAAMSNHAGYTPQQLAAYLGVKNVVFEDSIKQAVKEGAKSQMLTTLVFAYAAEAGLELEDPSNVKRVVSLCDNGTRWGVYVQQFAKYTDITVEHYSKFIAPITSGIVSYTVS